MTKTLKEMYEAQFELPGGWVRYVCVGAYVCVCYGWRNSEKFPKFIFIHIQHFNYHSRLFNTFIRIQRVYLYSINILIHI